MGVSTEEIFGDAPGSAATPGSYGEPPRGHRLPETTRLGCVHLQVADLTRSLAFYEGTLGLRILDRNDPIVRLAARGEDLPIVELHERPGARRVPRRGRTGLYHFAILLPDRPSLGRFVQHLGAVGADAGAADHLVSESLYLQDPDNLGIEVYADRPRSTWRRMGRELMMATDPLDVEGLVQAAAGTTWAGMPAGTTMGHVHLHVGDIPTAAAFFSEALGFDRTVWDYPGALFLSFGGYHHHLGTNTWSGVGATRPSEDDAQLLEWTIVLPNAANIADTREALVRAGHAADDAESAGRAAIVTRDPWGTPIRIASA